MITNVKMERIICDGVVEQRTKDGYFNATSLLNIFLRDDSSPKKMMAHFFENDNTKRYINSLIKYKKCTQDDVFISKKGKGGGTWMCAELYLVFSQWLSPDIEKIVIDNFKSKHISTIKFDYARVRHEHEFANVILKASECLSGTHVECQKKIMNYYVDIFLSIKITNTTNYIIEFDESHHKLDKNIQSDLKRVEDIADYIKKKHKKENTYLIRVPEENVGYFYLYGIPFIFGVYTGYGTEDLFKYCKIEALHEYNQ